MHHTVVTMMIWWYYLLAFSLYYDDWQNVLFFPQCLTILQLLIGNRILKDPYLLVLHQVYIVIFLSGLNLACEGRKWQLKDSFSKPLVKINKYVGPETKRRSRDHSPRSRRRDRSRLITLCYFSLSLHRFLIASFSSLSYESLFMLIYKNCPVAVFKSTLFEQCCDYSIFVEGNLSDFTTHYCLASYSHSAFNPDLQTRCTTTTVELLFLFINIFTFLYRSPAKWQPGNCRIWF